MKEHVYFVYMLASRRNGTLYTGVTNDVLRRAWKIKLIETHNSGWNDLYARLLGEIALPDVPGSPPPREADASLSRG